jgi:8-oxo-dGTP pyrophosphatase MutT (NUDIX family)
MARAGRMQDAILRAVLTLAHNLMKVAWFVRRPRTFGAHAIALTPENRIILVKLRYAPGWRVPGGGRAEEEQPAEAALRELREEIGMISHGEVKPARDFEEGTDFKRDTASLVVVRDVRYRPKEWSWEVEQVRESRLDKLPGDMSPISARWIEILRPLL